MPTDMAGGPFVQVAAICTTPLIEQQGHLSLIRIQDRIQIVGLENEMPPTPLQNLWVVVALKSGDAVGQYVMQLNAITPTGQRIQDSPTFNLLFEGQERGAVIAFPLQIVVQETGLYWFEVKLEEVVLSKIPLRVMYQKVQGVSQSATG